MLFEVHLRLALCWCVQAARQEQQQEADRQERQEQFTFLQKVVNDSGKREEKLVQAVTACTQVPSSRPTVTWLVDNNLRPVSIHTC